MHQGIEVLAFHAHFPTALPWFQGMAPAPANPAGCRAVQAMSQPYNEQWRRMGDFPAPERAGVPPGDEEQARRGQQELTQNGIRAQLPLPALRKRWDARIRRRKNLWPSPDAQPVIPA